METETKVGHLSEVVALIGVPSGWTIKAHMFSGRRETQLAKAVGLTQFGVNHVTLSPGSMASLRHWHEQEDEFVLVVSGELTLVDDNGQHVLREGSFAGFRAGVPNAHHLVNVSGAPASFVVVGTRKSGCETVHYPDDELGPFTIVRDANGERVG